MGTVKTTKGKLVIIVTLFMLMFSNFGYTLSAIATSTDFQVIDNGFFKKDEIKFVAYFEDEKGEKQEELVGDVNKKHKLVLEVNPQVEGYVKEAIIKAVGAESENINFKIVGIKQNMADLFQANDDLEIEDIPNIEPTVEEQVHEEDNIEEIESTESEILKEDENQDNTSIETLDIENFNGTIEENSSSDIENIFEPLENNALDEIEIVPINTIVPENTPEDEMINEEEVIQEEIEKQKILEQEMQNLIADIAVTNDDEVSLSNIKENTKIELEIEYIQGEELKIEDLYKKIKLQLSGTFINEDLEEVKIGLEEEIAVGWKYSNDIRLESEYTKFSPFEINEIAGTIVENKVVVTRNIEDEKYLPVRQTKLEVEVPKLNNKLPIEIGVNADRLLLTRGEDIGYTTFTQENWIYNQETGKIEILVTNELDGIAKNTKGVDEYIITYRYEDYVEEQISNLEKSVRAEIEEYSAKENNVIIKEINNKQDIKTELGEIITYNVSTSEEKINKAKTYANYNSEEAIYETDYTTLLSLHILTSDVLERLTIDCTKEVYKDINGVEFDAQINTKQIKFNYSEVSELLSDGGEIVITNRNNEVLYVLNKDLLVSEDVCIANVNNADGIIILVTGIAKNGTLNVELTKSITKCNYEKATFKNFVEIESRVTAEVKYKDIEEPVKLETKKVSKELEESKTTANISLNKETLTTIQPNENVEIKIVLNNDQENSDLYVNPSFEIVFPKYVKEVNVESINMLYEDGLKVADFETYLDNNIVKMRVDFEGIQTRFSESEMTNGTNIIINATIKVDKYTPAKEDQIKLYYCNEGVSNYGAQTKWTISKDIPNGILKTTNGFDVELIGYQAPTGLVVANGIVNYDGLQSEVTSVKQGEESRQIQIGKESRIATMELLALNNTGNKCTNVLFIGRVPFKGNKNVVTNEDLGTTTDALITDKIREDVQNLNIATIYYSSNPEATVDLENEQNGWTTEIANINEVRSYLIEVNGDMAPGAVLKYSYDFMIPENMPYDASIAGSFGAFYNNKTEVAVVYESSSADKVSLKTEAGPKLDATMTVDVGDGAVVLSNRRIKYTVTVVNNGSVPVDNVEIHAKIPNNTVYTKNTNNINYGDLGFEQDGSKNSLTKLIGTLNPGETREFSYYVTTGAKTTLEKYADGKDEKGYYKNKLIRTDTIEYEEEIVIEEIVYNEITGEPELGEDGNEKTIKRVEKVTKYDTKPVYEKEYITEVPDEFITNKATITTSSIAKEFETNEISNKLKNSNYISQLNVSAKGRQEEGAVNTYRLNLRNCSDKDAKDLEVVLNVGDLYQYVSATINTNKVEGTFDEHEGKIYIKVGELKSQERISITVDVKVKTLDVPKRECECYFEFKSSNFETEYSSRILQFVTKGMIVAEDISVNIPKKINEKETIVVSTLVKNIGDNIVSNAKLLCSTEGGMKYKKVMSNDEVLIDNEIASNMLDITLPSINAGESLTVDIILEAENYEGTNNRNAVINRKVTNDGQTDIVLQPLNIEILNSERTEKEIKEEEQKKLIEEEKRKEEEKKNQTNNNIVNEENKNENQNDSNNNINNETNKNDSNTNDSTTNQNQEDINSNKENETNIVDDVKYSIEGKAWKDENSNGALDESEDGLVGVQVYLLTSDSKMLKSTVTNSNGIYKFTEINSGSYIVGFSFDNELYQLTLYKRVGVSDDKNSDAISVSLDNVDAATNSFTITNQNIVNLNIGLKDREKFDLTVNKYLSEIKLTTSKETKVYKQEELEIAKLEIKSKYLEGAKVELTYTVVLKNLGNVEGYAEQIVDYLEEGLEFEEKTNSDWYKGTDGNVYTKNLKETMLKPGEQKKLDLILTKTMSEDNTGWITNKVGILNTFSQSNDKEDISNNTSSQNTFITVSTGKTQKIMFSSVILIGIGLVMYVQLSNVAKRYLIKDKIYKSKEKIKIKAKKIYK